MVNCIYLLLLVGMIFCIIRLFFVKVFVCNNMGKFLYDEFLLLNYEIFKYFGIIRICGNCG